MRKLMTVCLAILILFSVVGCARHRHVDIEQVDYVEVWSQPHSSQGHMLNEEDRARFVELYNGAESGGEPTGEGGTPDYGFRIVMKNGTIIRINEFCGKHDFESDVYLNSEELAVFAEELAKRYCGYEGG